MNLRFALPALIAMCGPSQAADWSAVEALFQDRCTACHSGEFAPLGLRLDSHEGVMAGSDNGPVLDTGDVAGSALVMRVEGRAEPQMPLDGPPFLAADEIALLRDWIAAGAPGPAEPAAPRAPEPPPDPMADGRITYDEVAGIFARACILCHSDNSKMGAPPEGLRLNSLKAILAGGDRVAVIPGNAQASELIRRVEGLSEPRMPFNGPPWLTDGQVALLRAWIDGGAMDADGVPAPVPVGGRVRFRGTMTGPAEIDGAPFRLTPDTRIDDRPAIGTRAELRARVGQDGQIIADRLRAR